MKPNPRGTYIIDTMKSLRWLALFFILIFTACQPNSPQPVIIRDGNTTITINTEQRVPLLILTEAGITPGADDRVLVNGILHKLDQPITTDGTLQLQLRRAVDVTIVLPQGSQTIRTSALTVGEALREAGFELSINDDVNPPLDSPVAGSTTVTFTPARDLVVIMGDVTTRIRSSAGTVGAALSQAGIPLQGLDTSLPVENEALPADGQIRVTRVVESISLEIESIPFTTQTQENPDLPFGQEEVIQPGVNGISMVRTRIRTENGAEVSRATEEETTLREPVAGIVSRGSKIVLSPVGSGTGLEYWLATEMYASWYSPCNSGISGCSYGTASGARAGFGIVAVDYSFYPYLAGMRVYIPGYGIATIGDTGGGPIIETALGVPRHKWIDLGYNDNNIGGLSGWVTVYFLAPAPAEIPYFLK